MPESECGRVVRVGRDQLRLDPAPQGISGRGGGLAGDDGQEIGREPRAEYRRLDQDIRCVRRQLREPSPD
jgi:hypothetical protein